MTIETIKAIVDQGAKAFADGKKTDANPYVSNPEHHMHWLAGYHNAALGEATPEAEAQAEQVEDTSETVQTETGTEQPETETEPTETEQPEVKTEAKASKKSKE